MERERNVWWELVGPIIVKIPMPCALKILGLSLFVCALFFGAACDSHSASTRPPARVEITQQWSGQHGGGPTPGIRTLRTVDEWKAFWKQAAREPPVAPDFARHMAVVISLGEKRTGGFFAEVIAVRHENERLLVEYRETPPRPGMMVTHALTDPWAAALIPQSSAPVTGQKIAAPKSEEK
jgi:hypothetical protein